MKNTPVLISIFVVFIFLGCGGPRVTHYEEARISSLAWAGDTLIAYSRNVERGFMARGAKHNAQQSVELWLARINPQRGKIDSAYQLRPILEQLGRIEFFPGGGTILYAAHNGVMRMDLATAEETEFFTHPSITNFPLEISVGPNESYVVIVVDAEGLPGTEEFLDLFMVETQTGYLMFHTDSLIDSKSFMWSSEDCIVYISPDPWRPGENKIIQFGVTDCIIKPSDLAADEVRCNCPQPELSGSGRWVAVDEDGKLAIKPYEN